MSLVQDILLPFNGEGCIGENIGGMYTCLPVCFVLTSVTVMVESRFLLGVSVCNSEVERIEGFSEDQG